MSKPLFIPIILGTNRENRQSAYVARFLESIMQERGDIETLLFDVRDFDIPKDDYGQALKEKFPEYREAIVRADGLVIVAPEYNHGYPGSMKSVIDLLLPEYMHKAVGLVGVSAGPWGGARAIEALVLMVRELGLSVSSVDLNFSKVQDVFDENGELQDSAYQERAHKFLDELAWLAIVLRWGRENIPSDLPS